MSAQPKKYKSLLQELCQCRKIPLPKYTVVMLDHAFPRWHGKIEVNGKVFTAVKIGTKKKDVEEYLAKLVYSSMIDESGLEDSTIIINPKTRDTLLIFDYSLKRVYDLFVQKVACNNVDVKVLCEESVTLDHDYIEIVRYSKGEHFMIELTMLVAKSMENNRYNKIIIVSNRKKVDHLVDVLNKVPEGPKNMNSSIPPAQKVNSFDSLISTLQRDEN